MMITFPLLENRIACELTVPYWVGAVLARNPAPLRRLIGSVSLAIHAHLQRQRGFFVCFCMHDLHRYSTYTTIYRIKG